MDKPFISIVIPCKNEAENLPELLDEIATATEGRAVEVIVVDDGSTDNTGEALAAARSRLLFPVRHIRHETSAGQSLSLRSGALAARGEIVVTMDGDGQNDPQYVPFLVDDLVNAGPSVGMAGGQRIKRQKTHTLAKNLASRFANWLRGSILQDKTRDSGCGLKAIRTEVLRNVPFFDGTHRFMAALVLSEGYDVVFRDVVDRPRNHGVSKYGILDRGLRGALDLIGVWWLKRRRRRMPKPVEMP